MDKIEVRLEELANQLSKAVEGTDDEEFLAVVKRALKEAYQLGKRTVAPSANLVGQ